MDSLIGLAESLAFNEALPEDIRSEIKLILETRKTNRWADAEADNAKAKEAQAQAMQKAAPKKSSAIRIEVRNRNLFYFVTQRSNWDHNIALGGAIPLHSLLRACNYLLHLSTSLGNVILFSVI